MDEIELLREYVRELVVERRKKRRKKPGGPPTRKGHERALNHAKFVDSVSATVKSTKGDVPDAARQLGVASRTLYHYLATDPGLSKVKTTADLEPAEERFEKKDD